MAASIARVALRRRPADTGELAITAPRRVSSRALTAPIRHPHGATHPAPATDDQFGPYVVGALLGEGGMARVHRAEMVGSDGFRKPVALKRMNTHFAEDPEFVASFVHEAQLASRLHHPNIVQAYDLGKIAGTYYIAMELVPGPTLAEVMAQAWRAAGPVPLAIVLEILIQLCDALEHAHELRDDGGRPLHLVHRDVSPANVIVSDEGTVKLIDFGIAKVRSARFATATGVVKGKHAYVAPEYTYGQLDHRADLFGVGVIAHELLVGRRLFVGATPVETIANVRRLPITPPSRRVPGVSAELDDIVMTALQRDPELRWQNAGAMRVALTTEARRLGLTAGGPQIKRWIAWAFDQAPRVGAGLGHLLEALEPSVSLVSGDLDVVEPPPPAAAVERTGTPSDANRLPSVEVRMSTDRRVVATESRAELAATVELPAPAARAITTKVRGPRRRPSWRVPTRWSQPPARSPAPVFVLVALLAFAALAVQLGWIDVDRWRLLLG